jgi:hypothetical protein
VPAALCDMRRPTSRWFSRELAGAGLGSHWVLACQMLKLLRAEGLEPSPGLRVCVRTRGETCSAQVV